MGFIDQHGVYHPESPDMQQMVPVKTSVWKQSDHDRQRQDHKAELVRPYKPDGTPSEEFIELYPEESINTYKFIKSDDQISKEQ